MSCTCQSCGKQYKVDLLIPDSLWERIKPEGKPKGAGLLCGACIMRKIEALGQYDAFEVVPKFETVDELLDELET